MAVAKPHELDYTFIAVCKHNRSTQVTPSLHLFFIFFLTVQCCSHLSYSRAQKDVLLEKKNVGMGLLV